MRERKGNVFLPEETGWPFPDHHAVALALGPGLCDVPAVEGGNKREEPEESPRERYGESYLAMDAMQKKAHPVVPRRRPVSKGGNKWLLFLLLVLALFYFQGARMMAWLEREPSTARILKTIRGHLRPADEKAGPPLTPLDGVGATGGETTFASGQGFGTVTPDDGSDSFRVVVPANESN